MKTVAINTYQFSELSDEAKQTAIQWYRDSIQGDDFWSICTFDDFIELAKTLGLELKYKDLSFSGFWSQGDGSHFKTKLGNRTIMDFINAVNSEAWKSHIPNNEYLQRNFRKIVISDRFKNLIDFGSIDMSVTTKSANRYSYMVSSYEFNTVNNNYPIPKIDAVIEDILSDVEENLKTLNEWFYKALQSAWEYENSDAAIIANIEGNEYDFTIDGNRTFTI